MSEAEVEGIAGIDKLKKSLNDVKRIIERQSPTGPVNREQFNVFMQKGSKEVKAIAQADTQVQKTENTRPSLLEAVGDANKSMSSAVADNASSKTVMEQTKQAIKSIEVAKEKLKTEGLELKPSVKKILNSKLNVVSEGLKVALARAGLEYKKEESYVGVEGPIQKFLGMLSHGQEQIDRLGGHVQMLQDKGTPLSPADLLAVQIKVGRAQHEIELFASILNKSLESIKTIMNVQV